MKLVGRMLQTDAPASVILIRLLLAGVFIGEGVQKFLFPAVLGVGRFAKIGIPAPQLMAPFVGGIEIGCGVLILVGLLTRLAAILLIVDMLVAIATTKIPMVFHGGFWSMAHEARTDYSMLLGAGFLLIAGGGKWSLDARLSRDSAPNP